MRHHLCGIDVRFMACTAQVNRERFQRGPVIVTTDFAQYLLGWSHDACGTHMWPHCQNAREHACPACNNQEYPGPASCLTLMIYIKRQQ